METLYLDTNIFLNVLLEEDGLTDSSYALLKKIEDKKYAASTSIMTLMEIHRILQKKGKKEEIIRKIIEKISSSGIEIIVPDKEDMLQAYEYVTILKIDPSDAIHLSIAASNTTILVTRDNEFSGKIKKLIKTLTPEQL